MGIEQQKLENEAGYVADIPIANIWHMLLYAWNEVPLRHRVDVDVDRSPSLDALLASCLAGLIQQRLRIGLGRSYVNDDGVLRGIRGRIDFAESVKKMTFETGQAYCRFQTYTANAPKNQIVRSVLMNLAQTGNFGPDRAPAEKLRQQLRRIVRDLDGVDVIEATSALIRRQHLGRNDSDYRLMLAICDLVLQRQMPTEQFGARAFHGLDRDQLTLHRIYERFVANFYRSRLGNWEVGVQKRLQWRAVKSSEFMPEMVLDLFLENRDDKRAFVIDTKFTAKSLISGRSEKLVFDSSHLYQMYAYLRTQEDLSPHHRNACGIILYPAARWHPSERMEIQGHVIRIETVNLAQPWGEIEKRLEDLL